MKVVLRYIQWKPYMERCLELTEKLSIESWLIYEVGHGLFIIATRIGLNSYNMDNTVGSSYALDLQAWCLEG